MAAAAAAALLISPSRPPHLCSPPAHLHTKPPLTATLSSSRFVAFSSFGRSNGTPPSETVCPVPSEQQPVNEYQSLSSSVPFSWATAALPHYFSRLALVGVSFSILVGLPVSFRADYDALHCAISVSFTGLLAVTLAVLRIYLGWSYVGNRLLSATVEYEETGWYDGQIWVKTPEVLARDRLLGSLTVKPLLNRVKLTLVGLAVSLAACGLLYINMDSILLEEDVERVVAGVYSEDSARSFEPEAFCGPGQSEI